MEVARTIRFPADLYKFLEELSGENERSLNGEIVYRLKESVGQTPGSSTLGKVTTLHPRDDAA